MIKFALENLKKSISLKWNENVIIDYFDDELQTDGQFYPSDYVLELQAVKTLYDYHNKIEDKLSKVVCKNCFIIADELSNQISYYRKEYQFLQDFVDSRLIRLGILLQNQDNNAERLTNLLMNNNSEVLDEVNNWYEESGRKILTKLEHNSSNFNNSVFKISITTLKDYMQALSNRYSNYNPNKILRIKKFWNYLTKRSEAFNNGLEKIEGMQNNFFNLYKSSYSSNDLITHYEDLINQLKSLPDNKIAKSCCETDKGICVAIMQADDQKWYTLSGLDDTNVLAESKNKIYDLSQKLSMPGFKYARLTGDVIRYTVYMGTDHITHKEKNHPFLQNPVKLSQDPDQHTQKTEYTCCERKLLASAPNAQHYKFFIKYKPCKRCLPAMAHDNIISNIYATEKGFYDQNETIKTITVEDLGNRTFRICEHFDIKKDY